MKLLLTKGDAGADVDALRTALNGVLGQADAATFPALSAPAGSAIDDDFDAAIRRWQTGIGVIADGVVGPRCMILLGLLQPVHFALEPPLNVGNTSRLFPATKPANIARYLPYVEAALGVSGLTDPAMVIGALGTIRAETEGFVPIAEFQSKFNTPPGGAPFSLYDLRKDLGNGAAGDGALYRGRGFVQLTGKANYRTYGKRIGLDLVALPDKANAPEVAAVILAQFLADKADKFRAAVLAQDLAAARKLVNGGSHGLVNFKDVFDRAKAVWPSLGMPAPAGASLKAKAKAKAKGKAKSKATAAVDALAAPDAFDAQGRASHTKKDAADLRDRLFQPSAISLPDEHPPQKELTDFLPRYATAGLILDQGREGACTGFGLTCVINYLRWVKAGNPKKMESVSPRMLYTLARRHDEYEGENYDGSSCRGALKGWFNNGVCLEADWPYEPEKANPARYGFADRATLNTLGVYYRIETKSITDMQAAIAQHRAIFVSAYTHEGWQAVPEVADPKKHDDLPRIGFDGRPMLGGGHAFALVGFNTHGFILQNSWGKKWGAGGFAVITYLDWLANGMDAWVVALGVPGVVAGRLAVGQGGAGAMAGVDRSKWWDTGLAYQHSVVLGNDGRVSRYLTEDEQPRKLQKQAYALPDEWFRTQPANNRKRLVLYVHGGLNSEGDAIKRASAMGRFFVANGCYPLFLVWKTGLFESIGDIISQDMGRRPAQAGMGDWLSEKTDAVVEKTIGRPLARPIWSEMKENADLAFSPRRGGELLLDALQALASTWGEQFELHLMGHSAGSIALGHFLTAMLTRQTAGNDAGLAKRLTSVHLYAPACTVAFANARYANNPEVMNRLYLDVLSDTVEQNDNVVSIYRKSLLYLVSNALESDLRTPILGLARIEDESDAGWDGSSDTGEALAVWRNAAKSAGLAARTTKVEKATIVVADDARRGPVEQPAGHGGFDNDTVVVTRSLQRIIGGPLAMPVDDLRGY